MHYRQLGRSGLRISSLTLGTMTFGGGGEFSNVGATDLTGAKRQIDMALDAGVNLIDTANMYSAGASEEILGQALGNLIQQGLSQSQQGNVQGRSRALSTPDGATPATPPAQTPSPQGDSTPQPAPESQPMNDVLRQLFNR